MNYRHAYHAGNFADVFKHAALAAILLRMRARPKPLCFLESHAGAGLYSLEGPQARRGGEAKDGILRLAELAPQHAALAAYLQIVKALEPNRDGLRVYPGSPLIAAGLLGAEDRLVLTEKVPEEADVLRQLFRQDARAAVHCRDGWEAIGALLPPTPRRGLLLVDPPYEAADDFRRVISGLTLARRRWPVGVLSAWYPIKDRRTLRPFHRALEESGLGGVLRVELSVRPDDNPASLNGSGMVIVSPPWGLEQDLRELVDELGESLRESTPPRCLVDWVGVPPTESH